jgi:septal ring factor EnvC (AmiA/AmiB activator)
VGINWSVVIQSGVLVALVGLLGILLKAYFDSQNNKEDRQARQDSAFLVSVLDDLKSLRTSAAQAEQRLDALNDRLQKAQADLIACWGTRMDLERQLREMTARAQDLEGQVKTLRASCRRVEEI